MAKSKYQTAPVASKKMPSGIPYIIGNEAAERFSFYGMKCILTVFMTEYLMGQGGDLAPMNESDAKFWYHVFTMAVYFTPLFGALISDIFLGKYMTIVSLSLVYFLGHLALALDETRVGLTLGLTLIAIGSGGIKPCVSAHVGDQFGAANKNLLQRVFSWFYFSINLGSFISTLLTPWLLEIYGPQLAFGVPGFLMLLATICFWMGRHKFVHIQPAGYGFVRETFDREGLKIIGRLCILYLFVSVFWSLFDQTGSAWVLQANHMDLQWMGMELLTSQIQAANPLMVMVLIPFCSFVVYPAINGFFPLTALRKVSIGFFVTIVAFAIPAWIQMRIDAGFTPTIGWQLLAYVVLTTGEVMISITCLEFSYTQAPHRMKSFVMAVFMCSISLGNGITAFVNSFIQNPDGSSKLEGSSYYWFFTALMAVTAIVFIPVAMRYKMQTFIQDGESEADGGS